VNLGSFLTVCSTILNHLYCSFAFLRLPFVQLCDGLREGVSRILSTFCLEMKVTVNADFKEFNIRACMIQLMILHLYIIDSASLQHFKVQFEQNFRLVRLLHSRFRTF
jgi:hypothetical protein